MRFFLTGLAACLFSMFSLTAASATSITYEFDVVDADLRFSLGASPSDPNFDDIIANLHPLGALANQSFSMVVEVTKNENLTTLVSGFATAVDITCVSGLLCKPGTGQFMMMDAGVHHAIVDDLGFHHYPLFTGDHEIDLRFDPNNGTGSLFFHVDFGTSVSGNINGTHYVLNGPEALFTLANVRATGSLAPVPLPAPVFLLGAGLIPLALLRRRGDQRT